MEKMVMAFDEWDKISSRIRSVLNFSAEQAERLDKNKVAKLIAATPFLAGCTKPMVTSFTHLTTYLVALDESARQLYFHSPEDDGSVYTRLHPLSHFIKGDASILQCCLDLLALTMTANYFNDAESDRAFGKYNPVALGKWDFTKVSDELIHKVKQNITPEIAQVYTIEDALRGVWQG